MRVDIVNKINDSCVPLLKGKEQRRVGIFDCFLGLLLQLLRGRQVWERIHGEFINKINESAVNFLWRREYWRNY